MGFDSGHYWERRYRKGQNSGAGSYGRLQQFKVKFVKEFLSANNLASVIDLGCGDGSFIRMAELTEKYVGVDVSATIVEKNSQDFITNSNIKFLRYDNLDDAERCDLGISLDVLYHLVEDSVFERYIFNLFCLSREFVVVYSSNFDEHRGPRHIKHRRFTQHVANSIPEWSLLAHIPNLYPPAAEDPSNTSFADFFVFGRRNRRCLITVPAIEE